MTGLHELGAPDARVLGRGAAAARDTEVAARVAEVEPMVRGICRGRLGDFAGDDAAQRVLLRIWEGLQAGREFDNLFNYAAATARYTAFPERTRSAVPTGDIAEFWVDNDAPGPAEQAERADEVAQAKARVEELLERLTPREVEVMRASVLADRSTAEAAQELGIKPTSVRSALVRAMARLREVCGTRSPNPLASRLSRADRDKARREARQPAVGDAVAGSAAVDMSGSEARTEAAGLADAVDDITGAVAATTQESTQELVERARCAVAEAVRTVGHEVPVAAEQDRSATWHTDIDVDAAVECVEDGGDDDGLAA